MSKNPYVFLVGCPRSGTTLLQRMLNSHPDLAITNDTHFIPRAVARTDMVDPPLSSDIVDRVRSYHRFPRLGLTDADVADAARGTKNYSDFVGRLYDAVARRNGKSFAGEKTPDYGRCIPTLVKLFPHARFIHIVRDGRDVALSTLDWATPTKGPGRWTLWADNPVATCALWWRWQISDALDHASALGPRKMTEIRYEDLILDTRGQLQRLAAFLDLAYDDRMETFYEGRTRTSNGLSAKSAWLPPTSGLRDWRKQMEPEAVALFEALAGDLLQRLGYESENGRSNGRTPVEVDQYRRWWTESGGKPRLRPRRRRPRRVRAGA